MDKTELLEHDITNGLMAVRSIATAGLPIAIAAWMRLRDRHRWELYIASPDVQKYGPTTVNRFVDAVLKSIGSPLRLDNVVIANTSNHFVNGITSQYVASWPLSKRTTNGDVLRLSNFALADVEVDEARVYKIAEKIRASTKAPVATKEAVQKARDLAA